MANYIGEHGCKIDAKGRVNLPKDILKQFEFKGPAIFVVNRSVFEKCLVLYTLDDYNKLLDKLNKLNRFKKENDEFIRRFTNGAVMVEMDSSNRILISKRHIEYADLKSDILLNASLNRFEIWSDEKYRAKMDSYEDMEGFAKLAERVMGSLDDD
ncbi:MAG: division/cell wall cluster transcriptional repressor MraZ [Flavobacteriales bacterium]